jgi:hypothetical protein
MKPLGAEEIVERDKDQNQREEATGLVIEEQTDEEQEGVSEQAFVLDKAEHSEDDSEESPKIELGEQQGMSLVERE